MKRFFARWYYTSISLSQGVIKGSGKPREGCPAEIPGVKEAVDVRLERAKKWLSGYIDTFRDSRGLLHPLMEMKRAHTLRVLENAERIVEGLGWSGALADDGLTASLLHDTGRFPQYATYGSYYDGTTVDHGALGAQVVAESFPWEGSDEGRRDILGAIGLHNRRELPEGLPGRTSLVVQLVRDSDKLDVLDVVRSYTERGRIGELLPKIRPEGGYSRELLKELSEHGRGSYKNIATLQDFLLLQLSWILDLNYRPSFLLLKEKEWLEWLKDRLPGGREEERVWRAVEERAASKGV